MTPFHELVYLGLAHLEVNDASDLHDARFLAWVRAAFPRDITAMLREDAPVLSSLYQAGLPQSRCLHALPLLHDSVEDFLASAALPIESLRSDHVMAPALLAAFQREDVTLLELLRADLALVARAFVDVYASRVVTVVESATVELAPWLSRAVDIEPSFDPRRVDVCHSLGAHGRALGGWILVGIAAPWNDLDAPISCIQALHEHAVHMASETLPGELGEHERHQRSEGAAMKRIDARITRAHPTLQDAHRRWRARYE